MNQKFARKVRAPERLSRRCCLLDGSTDTPSSQRLASDAQAHGLLVRIPGPSHYDLHQKLDVYRRVGVREYLVLRTEDREVDWFVLRCGAYERLQPDGGGILRSEVFPGLELDVEALLRGRDPGPASERP